MRANTRKAFAGLFSLFWAVNSVVPTLAYAADNFAAGRAMGNAQLQSSGLPSSSSLTNLPGYDSSTNYNAIGEQYFKSGRNSLSDLGTIYDAGTTVKNQSSTCAEGDNACSGRNLAAKKYSLTSPSNPYKQDAMNMRAGIDKDPLSVLGIGVPNQNGGSVCVESTSELPPTTEEKTCLEAQWKTLNVISKLPTTTTVELSNPTCIDGYTLSADGSVCEKTVYSCPQGGTLDGMECVTTTEIVDYAAISDGWDVFKCTSPGSIVYEKYYPAQTIWTVNIPESYDIMYCKNNGTLVNLKKNPIKPSIVDLENMQGTLISKTKVMGMNTLPNTLTAKYKTGEGCSDTNTSLDHLIPYYSLSQLSPLYSYPDSPGPYNNNFDDYHDLGFSLDNSKVMPFLKKDTQCGSFFGYTVQFNENSTPSFPIEKLTSLIGYTPEEIPLSLGCGEADYGKTFSFRDPNYSYYASARCNNDGSISLSDFSDKPNPPYKYHGFVDALTFSYTLRFYSYSNAIYNSETRTLNFPNGTLLQLYPHTTTIKTVSRVPATATYETATPGCLGGQTLTRSDQLVQAGCSVLSGGTWQSKASRSLTTTDVLDQYIDIDLSCNFDATDTDQFIGLDNFTGVTGLYVDRVKITPSDGSTPRIIKAEERTASNTIPLNAVNDPTASDGMAHYATPASKDVSLRPWGLHASDVGLPRFSDTPATVSIRIRSDHINEQTTTDPGNVLCSSQDYTCPAGQVLNGYVCEDVDRQDYLANPNCVNLGYDPDTESEAFYCTEQKLDECAEMPQDCTEVNSACIYTDEVPGSPTPGACLATEKTFSCPVPAKTVSKVSCGYDPMCFNGECFTPPDGQCAGVTEEVTKTRISTCYEHREQTIGQCSLVVTKDPYGGNPTYTLGTDCQQYADNPQCVQIPVLMDDEGNYPDTTAFSCLGDPVNDCERIMNDTSCDTTAPTRTCVDYEDMNGSNGRCVHTQLDYTCTDTLSMPGDECTQDLSKVLISMEAGRQAGNYMDINDMRLFKGEYSRCDRRVAGFMGAGIGSKSCCNISAPDPQNNSDVMTSQIVGVASDFAEYGASKASAYMYDYMMSSDKYADAAMQAWQSGFVSDATTAGASNVSLDVGLSYAGIGLGYSSTAVAAGATATTTSSLGVTTYSYGLGGGMQLTFTPVLLYVYVAILAYQMYQQALACDETDYMTATKNDANLCYNTHTFCAKKDCGLFGCTCTKYRTAQCCYNSVLSKLINQQGKAQLGISGESDKCDGFTVEQIQNLDWSKIDLSEFVAQLLTQAQKGVPTAADLQKVTQRVTGNVGSDGTLTHSTGYVP